VDNCKKDKKKERKGGKKVTVTQQGKKTGNEREGETCIREVDLGRTPDEEGKERKKHTLVGKKIKYGGYHHLND